MKNPVIPGYAGDPFVLCDGEDFYMVPTCDSDGWQDSRFYCYHSRDLQTWSQPQLILDVKDLDWADRMAWAPCMLKCNGYYYICFGAEQQIGIAVCESPTGRFRDLLGAPLLGKDTLGTQTIDPCLFEDDNGKTYLAWGQGKGYLSEIELTPTSARLTGKTVCLSDEFYYQFSRDPGTYDPAIFCEGIDLVKLGGRYLLSWSVYDTRDVRYSVRYAWADSVFGPYIQPIDERHDNVLVCGRGRVQCTGHATVFDKDGELYLAYHRFVMPRKGYLREACIDRIVFDDADHMHVELTD